MRKKFKKTNKHNPETSKMVSKTMSENIEFGSHFWLHFRNQNGLQIVQKSIPNLMHNVHAFLVSMFIDV